MVTRPASLTALLLALISVACDSPRCKPIERCDIRKSFCQKRALRLAACLRERDENEDDVEVAVRTLDLDSYRERVEEELRDDAQNEQLAQMRRGLALIGLEDPDWSAKRAAQENTEWVGAYYDSEEKQVTLIERGYALNSAQQVIALVHEMTHALQDVAGQLDIKGDARQWDQLLARRALIEGEATLVEDQATTEGYGYAFFDIDYAGALAQYRKDGLAGAASARSAFERAYSYFTYAYGASYLWERRERKRSIASAAAFDELPQSTYAVMAKDPQSRPNDLGDEAVPDLPDLTLVGTYHLGRFLYEVFRWPTANVPLSFDWAPGGHAFEADTFSVFVDAEGRVLTSWRLRFDDAWSAEGFAAHLIAANPEARIEAEGSDVWWLTAERDELLEALPAELSWTAAPEFDFGFGPDDPGTESGHRVLCLQASARR
jgi:hypothetical protein